MTTNLYALLTIPGAIFVVLSHTKGDISKAGPIVSIVWILYGVYAYCMKAPTP